MAIGNKLKRSAKRVHKAEAHMELFETVIDALRACNHATWPSIAEEAGVCLGTLYRWTDNLVWCPHLRTVVSVANALGYDVILRKQKKVRLRSVK